MTEAIIGLAGLLIGLLINEYFRKSNRIENYSSRVFDKRLTIYEELMLLVHEKYSLVLKVVENDEIPKEEARSICHSASKDIFEFCNANQLYLNKEIVIHIASAFSFVVAVFDMDMNHAEEKSKLIQGFSKYIENAKQMILAESGIEELNDLFKKITKAKHSSEVIKFYRWGKKNKI